MSESGENICALCHRPLGERVEKHHLIPRLKGGKETVTLHPICHRKIHQTFSEAVLAKDYNSAEKLRAHEEIAFFIQWVEGKPPDFYKSTRSASDSSTRRRRRR